MSSGLVTIEDPVLTWEEMSKKILTCSQKIRYKMHKLSYGGTLSIDMGKVNFIDRRCAFETVGYLQQNLTGGPYNGRHVILIRPKPLVIETIESVVNDMGIVFIELDCDNLLRVRGKGFTPHLKKMFHTVLTSKEKISIQNLEGISEIEVNIASSSNFLRTLFDWGLLCRQEVQLEEKTKGRPRFEYYPYWPEQPKTKNIWTGTISWEVFHEKGEQHQIISMPDNISKSIAS